MFIFNPTPAESSVLAQIQQHESGGDYTAVNPKSGASGAYQFLDSTWRQVAQKTGVGTQYASAADAPPSVQDTNALWLLQNYGPNSTTSWGGPEGPPGGYPNPYSTAAIPGSSTQPIVDLSGDAASTSSADILSSLQSSMASIDLTNPITDAMLLAAGAVAVALMARR
jgi:hypothetical protein